MNCPLHVHAVMQPEREHVPEFAQGDYGGEERNVLHCPVVGCYQIALGAQIDTVRQCNKCGKTLTHNSLTDKRCYNCKGYKRKMRVARSRGAKMNAKRMNQRVGRHALR